MEKNTFHRIEIGIGIGKVIKVQDFMKYWDATKKLSCNEINYKNYYNDDYEWARWKTIIVIVEKMFDDWICDTNKMLFIAIKC